MPKSVHSNLRTDSEVKVYTKTLVKGVFSFFINKNKRFALPVPKSVHSSLRTDSEVKVYTKTLVKGVFSFFINKKQKVCHTNAQLSHVGT